MEQFAKARKLVTQWRKRGTDSREAKGGDLTHTAVS